MLYFSQLHPIVLTQSKMFALTYYFENILTENRTSISVWNGYVMYNKNLLYAVW